MNRQRPTVKAEDCAHCPAFMADEGSAVCAEGISVIPSRMAVQVTDGVWNAVVTTLGKGTFLLRRPEHGSAGGCPLHMYEVRHIEAKPRSRRKRVMSPAGHSKGKDTCGDLFVRILAGRA